MNKYKNTISFVLLLLGSFCCSKLSAKVRTITSRRELEQTIAKKSIIVVLFYDEQKNGMTKDLTTMYEDLSKYQPYNDADLIFLKVNTKRKELANLAELYHSKKIPSFVFFSQGMQLLNSQKLPIVIEGNISRSELQNFISRTFANQMQSYIGKKVAKRKAIIVEEGESWKPYFYDRDMFVRGYSPEERDME